jgi:hypothetical protein
VALSDLLQDCSNKSDIQSWYNKNETRLTAQGWNNIVISWLYIGHVQTSPIISTRLLQVVNSLFQTWDKQCEHNLLTACWQTCYKMWDFYACSWKLAKVRRFEQRPFVEKSKFCLYFPSTHVKISNLVASLPTSCLRTACPKLSTSLEQTVNNL